LKPVLIDLDIAESLSLIKRKEFELRTGLVKAPVTIILPPEAGGCLKEALRECEIVMVFLHGLGGGRWSWGVSPRTQRGPGQGALYLAGLRFARRGL
jgi:hypothetical protein